MIGRTPAARIASAVQCRRRPARRGFTIIEVALALFVLAFVIAAALVTLQSGFKQLDNARYTTLAGQILQSQMEKLRLLNWNQLTNSTDGASTHNTFIPDVTADTETQAIIAAHFTCTQTISAPPVSSPFHDTMRDITLTVTWSGTDRRVHSLSYVTRYGENGISDFFVTTH